MNTSVNNGGLPQGDKYPLDTKYYAPTGEDRSLCDQGLRKESMKLFQIAGGGINVLSSPRDDRSLTTPPQQLFLTSEGLEKQGISLYLREETWQHIVFIIRPAFSWSQLSVTEQAFRNVLADIRVFTPFLNIVHTFGTKTSDKQRATDLIYHHMELTSSAYEFCYNIRYFELNGRGRGNPWSLRQTGVYQRCSSDKRSIWILLNFSGYVNDRMAAALREQRELTKGCCESRPILPHLYILFAATSNWRSYIEYLHQRLVIFEEKAFSSRINETYTDDYRLAFSDVQQVMSLGDAIALAASVISRQRDVLSECTELYTRLHKRELDICECVVASTIAILKVDLQHYHEAVANLTRSASETTQLLSSILTTRKKDALLSAVARVQTGVTEVQSHSRQTHATTDQLLQVTTKGQNDTTTMKILAQAATMFLPASLIASIFSSTIFDSSDNSISYVALYFAITAPLLLVTFLFLVLLEMRLNTGKWSW